MEPVPVDPTPAPPPAPLVPTKPIDWATLASLVGILLTLVVGLFEPAPPAPAPDPTPAVVVVDPVVPPAPAPSPVVPPAPPAPAPTPSPVPVNPDLPTLTLPAEIKGEPGTFIAVRAESSAAWVNFKADTGLAVFPSNLLSDRKATVLTAAKAGRYRLFAYTGSGAGGVDAETVIVVGNAPPVPPGPVPDPVPPDVDPNPPPVVDTGFRVLIVFDNSSKASLPREQLAAIDSLDLRAYLNSHCIKAANGAPEWRITAATTQFSDDQPIWKKAMALPRTSLPWLVVSNGKEGESIPLPANEAALMEVITKYGGK